MTPIFVKRYHFLCLSYDILTVTRHKSPGRYLMLCKIFRIVRICQLVVSFCWTPELVLIFGISQMKWSSCNLSAILNIMNIMFLLFTNFSVYLASEFEKVWPCVRERHHLGINSHFTYWRPEKIREIAVIKIQRRARHIDFVLK